MAPRGAGGEPPKKQLKLGKAPPETPKAAKGQLRKQDNPKKDDPKNQKDEPMPEVIEEGAAGTDAVKLELARDGEEEAASGAADLVKAGSAGSQDAASGLDLVKVGSGSAESQDAASCADLVEAGSGSAGSRDAASGAADPAIKLEPAATEEVMGWSLAKVLEMDSLSHQTEFIRRWSINMKKASTQHCCSFYDSIRKVRT